MLFTSLEFFGFLLLALLIAAGLRGAQRGLWLLAASWVFYGLDQPAHLIFLGAVTTVVLGCIQALDHSARPGARRLSLTLGLLLLLGALLVFKFYDFGASQFESWLVSNGRPGARLPRLGLTAPAGFSFYVFSGASLLIDRYAGRVAEPPGWVSGAVYLAWFPKILAGPIERATTFLPQLSRPTACDPRAVVQGLQLIGWGLIKKVVIADNLAPLVDHGFKIVAYASPVELLCSAYFFAFQIYGDFSGYTDVALGVSLLFGFRLAENFRRPYLSRSTAEFWGQRWHISLSRWFRDYLYIPLGGSRTGRLRQYLNLMLVFVVSGLWHAGLGYGVGWTFLVWGALNGAYQWVGLATRGLWARAAARLPRLSTSGTLAVARIVFTFHLILVSWVFFRAKSVGDGALMLQKIATHALELPSIVLAYPFTADQGLAFALIAFLLAVELIDERRPVLERIAALPVALRWAIWYLGFFVLLTLGRWQTTEFIYMQF